MIVRLLLLLGLAAAPLTAHSQSAQSQPVQAPLETISSAVASQPAAARDDSSELDAIRKTSAEFVAAFNRGDAKAIAALWTENGDYTDETGRVLTGRTAIEQEYAAFFKDHTGVTMQIDIDSLRLLSDDAAIEDGRAVLDPSPAGPPAISKYTVVHVKVDGKWLMSTVRDERIETPSGYRHLEDLEWLVGDWAAEEHGAKTVSHCRWVANKSFVQRDFAVTHHDGRESSGVQVIGFNPQRGRIESWNFASDGGHAVGVWTPRENGWRAELRGMTGQGVSTRAVVLLTRIDDNAYAWQSVQRVAGNQALPDTDEVVIKRTGAK